LVVAHQLLGLRKEFLDRFAEWIKAQPSVSYLHDFYAFCPRVNLIDATGQFCDIPNVKICERCVKAGGSHEASRLTQLSVVDHRALFTRIFTNIGHVISPSLNTEHYFRKVMPKVDILTIPHPQTLWQFPAQPRLGSASNIVLLGAIGSHKGSKVLLDIANRARLTHPHLHFHVVGYTNRDTQLMAFGNVSITGEYQAAELRRLIDTTGGRFALFLHCWPETFSYALTEAVAAGLIPLVPDVGAPAERVKAAGFGRVYPFTSDAARVLEALDLLINEPASLHDNGPGPQAFAPVPSTVDTTRTLFAGLMAGHSGNARRAPRRSNATAGAASPLLRVG
jgi:glycosyltransferase involved in cell wall biosynthesis